METKKIIQFITLVMLLMLPTVPAFGQILYGQPTSGSTGFVYTSWTLTPDDALSGLEEVSISQFWIPINGYLPLKENLEARIFLASSSTNLEGYGSEIDISGLSDVSIQFSQSLADDQWLISAGFNLPTGKKKFDVSTERAVLQTLSQSFLDFPMRRYGEGFGFNLLVGTARQVGELMLSGGVIFRSIGAYEPYSGVDEYDPGDNININASAETKLGAVTWTTTVIFTNYLADQVAGRKVFKQGKHLNLSLGALFSNEQSAYGGQLRYMIRSRNSWYEGETETVSQQLKLYGNELNISFSAALKLNDAWQLKPIAAYRLIEENEGDLALKLGSSNILTIGATGSTKLNEKLNLDIGLKYLTGQANANDNLLNLSGLQLTTGLTASF